MLTLQILFKSCAAWRLAPYLAILIYFHFIFNSNTVLCQFTLFKDQSKEMAFLFDLILPFLSFVLHLYTCKILSEISYHAKEHGSEDLVRAKLMSQHYSIVSLFYLHEIEQVFSVFNKLQRLGLHQGPVPFLVSKSEMCLYNQAIRMVFSIYKTRFLRNQPETVHSSLLPGLMKREFSVGK